MLIAGWKQVWTMQKLSKTASAKLIPLLEKKITDEKAKQLMKRDTG